MQIVLGRTLPLLAPFLLALGIGLASPTLAAKIERVNRVYCTVLLSGPIQKGDFERLKTALDDSPRGSEIVGEAANVCLNSSGGDLAEGLRILEYLIESSNHGTVIDDGDECFDVCAFVFMGGRYEFYHALTKPSRRLHVRGKLGFRPPVNKVGPGTFDREAVQQAYTNASAAISGLIEIESKRSSNTGNRIMPRSLMLEILGREPEDTLNLETLEQALLWNVTLIGFAQPKEVTQSMLMRACSAELLNRGKTALTGDISPGPDRPITLNNGHSSTVFKAIGSGKDLDCTVQVFRHRQRGYFLNVNINPSAKKDPYTTPRDMIEENANRYSGELNRVGIGFGEPVWYLLPLDTQLSTMR